ncbi:MAG: adenylosuccinate lyase [candidate division Zixibacteria bacterium]|nr:adenylosuccinate lyase [candidate division Zixibacteria bacterium]
MIERYTLPEMGKLWSEENKFKSWLKVEIEAARAMAQFKMIPAAAARSIEKKAKFKVSEIDRIEKEVNHDVLAFLTSVSKSIGSDAKYLHFGLTSSDVVDTALSMRIKEAAGIIDKKLAEAINLVAQMAKKYKNVPCIGRTHGVLAEPMTVGLKFSVWYTELKRSQVRFRNATAGISVGKLSGAVGNFANVDPKVEAAVCKRLGLKAAEVSTQVIQRDRHAAFITSIAILGSSLEKFATEIRNLQRTEIGEMYEGFTKGQKGSSSMPHKKNPITAERITGIARLLRGYALSAMENIPLWHERDIAHSSVERVIIPDATTLIDYSLHKFIGLITGLVINKERMLENIYFRGGLVFSQRLLLKLTETIGSREKAYKIVQKHGLAAIEKKLSFKEAVLKDKDIRKYLKKSEIENCFELKPFVRNVDKIFKRVFTA